MLKYSKKVMDIIKFLNYFHNSIPHSEFIVKYKFGLNNLLQQGVSVPVFYVYSYFLFYCTPVSLNWLVRV